MKLGFKLLFASILSVTTSLAYAVPVTITVTADNAMLEMDYCTTTATSDPLAGCTGPNSGSIPFFGLPNATNWKKSDTIVANLASEEYWFIFEAAQFGSFSAGNPAAFLAQITDPVNGDFLTDSSWEFSYNGFTWHDAESYGRNEAVTIWSNNNGGPVAGIDGAAEWIWGDVNFSDEGAQTDETLYFRTIVQVPEPGTLVLFGLGLVGMGFGRRKATG